MVVDVGTGAGLELECRDCPPESEWLATMLIYFMKFLGGEGNPRAPLPLYETLPAAYNGALEFSHFQMLSLRVQNTR